MAMMSDRIQSEFHSAISFLNRINYYFLECDESRLNYDSERWYSVLWVLYAELSDDMKKEERKKIEDELKNIKNNVDKSIMKSNVNKTQLIEFDLYLELNKIEIKLRQIYKKCGYKTKVRGDPRLSMI